MQQEKTRRVTLRDIAAKTGFSVNTVSHALKDQPDISDKTKRLIRKTAQEMGYIRNSSAVFLRSGVSKSIAIVLGDLSNPLFAIMVKGLEVQLKEKGYVSSVSYTHLFGMIEIEDEALWNAGADTQINRKWWDYMADIMECNPDNSPVPVDLPEVFHLD